MSFREDRSLELPPPPWIIGHRGAAGAALENTLAAAVKGVSEGASMIEVDVQISGDGVPLLFHDWDLRRLAGRSEIIERTSARRLHELPLHNPFGENTLRIPSLEAALAEIRPDVPMNLELKRRFHDTEVVADALAPFLDTSRPLLISSFDWTLLAAIRRSQPRLSLAPLGRWKADELLSAAEDLGAFSVHAHRELAPEIVARSPRPVLAYTVNDPVEARRLLDLGVSGLFTDVPGALKGALTTR